MPEENVNTDINNTDVNSQNQAKIQEMEDETKNIFMTMKDKANRHEQKLNDLGLKTKEIEEGMSAYLKSAEWKSFEEKVNTRLDQIDDEIKALSRPNLFGTDEDEEKRVGDQQVKAWFSQLRYNALVNFQSKWASEYEPKPEQKSIFDAFAGGRRVVAGVEVKAAMTTELAQRAGYLVTPPERFNEIINQSLNEISPMRQMCKIRQTTSNTYEQPSKTARGTGYWVGETATRTENTSLTYGLETIPVHEMAVIFKVSQTLLEDAAYNMQVEMIEEYTEDLDVLEGTGLVTGNSIQKPEGIMTNASISSYNQEEADDITKADSIEQLPFQLKEPYTRNAAWMMRRATMGKVFVIKGGDGHPLKLLTPRKPGGANYDLVGYPVYASPDMPAVAANAYPIIFGDFKKGYLIIDKVITNMILIDPYTSKDSSVVEFLYRKRMGGKTLIPEAFYKLKIAET